MYRKITVAEKKLSDEEVFNKKLFNVFVLGLPRTGTSMMMGIIERLGVKIISTSDTEEELKKRNERERKRYGDKYQMNPDGFYEITKNPWDHFIRVIATPYSGCKLVIPIGRHHMQMVLFNPCAKVIMMWRDPEETRQSQQASYKAGELPTKKQAETQRAQIKSLLVTHKLNLEKQGIDTLHIEYQDVLRSPREQVLKVAEFINAESGIEDAVEWVDPEKNRFRKENLIRNI